MKPSAWRTLIRRYGHAGVLFVALSLGLHSLWSRYRWATVSALCGVPFLIVLLCQWWTSPPPARVSTPPRVRPATSGERRPAPAPVLPLGSPLLQRATPLLRAENAWSWGCWDHSEYGWISDTELFFAEAQPQSGKRVSRAHLYRYNVRTGKKTRLKRLEGLVDCFYHSQLEVSPDGKWLLWHGESKGQDTFDVATLEGRQHRSWSGGYFTLHRLGWTRDSRHWLELKHDRSFAAPSQVIVHSVDNANTHSPFSLRSNGSGSEPSDFAVGDRLVFLGQPSPEEISRSLNVMVFSLPPHVRQERTEQISLPASLSNPNIATAILSPDATRIALIVGYDAAGVRGNIRDSTEGNAFDTPSASPSQSIVTGSKRGSYCLLVCRRDGSAMHSVGTWQEEINPNGIIDVENLRWLPSGASLSFFYHDMLYKVSAD